ncbi:hypothetical protein G210_4195 [Candida maltosa Xu316]|uniref:Uncharacterized protein n=1 Tax=Candida maltosa (strain Xu316) TaxID=1245528 RepID=M3JTE1_CANMX|nr:hypothetical protein G210_4195 [Candida maltosa Xu316]
MTYSPNIPQDKSVHDKYHANFVNGLPWVTSNDTDVSILETFTVVDRKVEKSTGKLKSQMTRQSYKCSIVSINKANKKHIQKIEKLLVMVNQELNASEDSGQWKSPKFDKSKAFVLIIDNKAIGLCTTDTIEGDQGRWMIYKSQTVVPKQINKNVIIGISRIWWENVGEIVQWS